MKRSISVLLLALPLAAALVALAYVLLPHLGYSVVFVAEDRSSFTFEPGALTGDEISPLPSPRISRDDSPQEESSEQAAAEVRSLVVLLADGVGFSHLAAARVALAGAGGRLTVERFPVASWHTTFSAEGMYTDSAAGATALATGVLTTPGFLSVDPDGRPVPTLMEEALAAGKSAAVVTDSYLWDASPAAWLVHHDDRRDYDEVARQMAASEVNLAVGEARRDEEGSDDLAARLDAFRDAGYAVARTLDEVEDVDELDEPGSDRQVVLLPPGSVADPDAAPELADLVDAALERLTRNPEGFVLFVETEEVDSGAHNGDLDRVIRGLGSLDAAARRVVDYATGRDDVLVVFTGDHETGGLALANSRAGEALVPMWAWGYHTATPVPLLAWGPGAERLMGVHQNAEVGRILRRLLSPAGETAPATGRAPAEAAGAPGPAPGPGASAPAAPAGG